MRIEDGVVVFRVPPHERDETDYREEEILELPPIQDLRDNNSEQLIQWLAWGSLGVSIVMGVGSLPYFWKRRNR